MMKEYKRESNGDVVALAEALASVYATKQWTRQWQLFQLVKSWPAIVGEQVAALTAPAFFRREVLWIHVQDSAWMQHLQYVKLDLLDRVNVALGDQPATDLRWLQRAFTAAEMPRSAPEPRPIDPARERMFIEMASSIPNLECRKALLDLWRAFAAYEPE